MESDIEEGEIIEETPPLIQKESSTAAAVRKKRKSRSSISIDRPPKRPSPVRSTAPSRVFRRATREPIRLIRREAYSNSRDRKRSRHYRSKSPVESELPRQYQIRLRENINRRRLESARTSRSRSPLYRRRPKRAIPVAKKPTNSNNARKQYEPKHAQQRKSIFSTEARKNQFSHEDQADSDDSVVSLAPPPKTPPPLIQLDSSHDSDSSDDTDVRELQLRKEALEALLNKFANSEIDTNGFPENEPSVELYSPYSPTSDVEDITLSCTNDFDLRQELEALSQSAIMCLNGSGPAASSSLHVNSNPSIRLNDTIPNTAVSQAPMLPGCSSAALPLSNGNFQQYVGFQQFPSSVFAPLPVLGISDVDMRFTVPTNVFNTTTAVPSVATQSVLDPVGNQVNGPAEKSMLPNSEFTPSTPVVRLVSSLSEEKLLLSGVSQISNEPDFPNSFYDVDCRRNLPASQTSWTVTQNVLPVPNPFQLPSDMLPSTVPIVPADTPSNSTQSETADFNKQQPMLREENINLTPAVIGLEQQNLGASVDNNGSATEIGKIHSNENVENEELQSRLSVAGNCQQSTTTVTFRQADGINRNQEREKEPDIVISVSNDKFLAGTTESIENDTPYEDEEVLRAQLLLDIAKKKMVQTAMTETPVQNPRANTAIAAKVVNTGVKVVKPPNVVRPVHPSPMTRITKSFQNDRSKNRQFVRIIDTNAPRAPPPAANTITPLENRISPTVKSLNGLQNIKRTVINNGVIKKKVYNPAADPMLKNLTITVRNKIRPTTVTPLIIPLRPDETSSDEDDNEPIPTSTVEADAAKKLSIQNTPLAPDFETSLNNLLKSSRDQSRNLPLPVIRKEATVTPEVLRLMPSSKRDEYMHLKQQIADAERRIQRKQEKRKQAELKRENAKGNRNPHRVLVEVQQSSVRMQAGYQQKSQTPGPKGIGGSGNSTISSPVIVSTGKSSEADEPANMGPTTNEARSQGDPGEPNSIYDVMSLPGTVTTAKASAIGLCEANMSTSLVKASNELLPVAAATEAFSTDETRARNCVHECNLKEPDVGAATEPIIIEDPGKALAKVPQNCDDEADADCGLRIRVVPAEKLLETDSEDDMEVENTAADTRNMPKKSSVSTEREELYLREKLLKAALLKKMEDSSEMLLKRTEKSVMNSRGDINRELSSLLSDLGKMSELKTVIKSREDTVQKLRKKLRIAERKLHSSLCSYNELDKRRRSQTDKVLTMRKQFHGLVKQCKTQGEKLKGRSYTVPIIGALEMKSRLVEVRNQNVMLNQETGKIKRIFANLQSPQLSNLKIGKQLRQVQPSPSVVAANRFRKSMHNLVLKRNGLAARSLSGKPLQRPRQLKRGNFRPRSLHYLPQKSTSYTRLTKYGNVSDDNESTQDMDSIFLLPKNVFKDVLTQTPSPTRHSKFIPILPFKKYESPLESIRTVYDPSEKPVLSRIVDPFTALCVFELEGICNDTQCAFQHLYRSQNAVKKSL